MERQSKAAVQIHAGQPREMQQGERTVNTSNYEMENEGGMSGLSFVLGLTTGIALGIVGTIIFATYQEEKFGHVTRKTRELGDQAQDTALQLKDKVTDKVGDVTEAAKNQIKKATGKLQEQVDSVRNGATDMVNS